MPSEGSDGIGAGESAGCRMGFSLPFPSIPHFYRFHRIHRIRPFRRPSPTQLNRHSHGSGNLESRGFQSFPIDSRRVGGLDSRLCGNDEFQDYGVVGTQLNRHSHGSGNLESRGFQSFPIDSRRVGGLDSRLCGNDESIHTGTCTTSFPRKWESRISGFQSFPIDSRRVVGLDSRLRGNDGFQDYGVVGRVSRLRCCRNATEPSFPRKW
ncbi:hypothetical protein NM3042_0483, partial [Neisseria meningitidis NM3042]